MADLDLDINNYSIKDIEKFLKLKSGSKYTASDIEQKEYEIREQLLQSGHINKRMKRDLIEFLTLAKQWLIYVKCKAADKPSTIPKNAKLDTMDYPRSQETPTTREGELIHRPETNYTYTATSDFFPGTINPLNTRIVTKCLTVDTRFRNNIFKTEASDFLLQLPMKLNKVVSMQLSSIELPVSYYGISSSIGNNFLNVTIKQVVSENIQDHIVNIVGNTAKTEVVNISEIKTENKIIVIPDGNYDACEIINIINLLLHAPRADVANDDESCELFKKIHFKLETNSYGIETGKVIVETIDKNDDTILEIILDFTKNIEGYEDNENTIYKLGWNLGFTFSKYEGGLKYISETLIDTSSLKYLYLSIDDYNNNVNNHFISAFGDSNLNPNILARISIKKLGYQIITQDDLSVTTEPRRYFGPVDISKMQIRLLDDRGRVLNINKSNYSFCLVFKMLYDL
jgi:hypothetical protein